MFGPRGRGPGAFHGGPRMGRSGGPRPGFGMPHHPPRPHFGFHMRPPRPPRPYHHHGGCLGCAFWLFLMIAVFIVLIMAIF